MSYNLCDPEYYKDVVDASYVDVELVDDDEAAIEGEE